MLGRETKLTNGMAIRYEGTRFVLHAKLNGVLEYEINLCPETMAELAAYHQDVAQEFSEVCKHKLIPVDKTTGMATITVVPDVPTAALICTYCGECF